MSPSFLIDRVVKIMWRRDHPGSGTPVTPAKEAEDLHPAADRSTPSESTATLTPEPTSRRHSVQPKASDRSLTLTNMSQLGDERDVERGEKAPSPVPVQQKEPQDPNLIDWDGPDDPENPQNWSNAKKWAITMILAVMVVTVTFASSIFSTASIAVSKKFDVPQEVGILGVSVFVLGFAFGPIAWGPLSERFGRMIPLFSCFAIFAIFQIPVAVAQNIYTIIICRFLAGFFGSAPLVIVGGVFADYWNPVERGVGVSVFAAATFLGPVAGPIVGGFLSQSSFGWRSTAWITLIMAAASGGVGLLMVPETHHGTILQRRAARIRFQTKNWAVHAQLDEESIDFNEVFTKYLVRPWKMLVLEPILLLISIYLALIYGILYLFFVAYPISFQDERGWNQGVGALPFLGIMTGVVIGAVIVAWLSKTRFAEKLKKHGRIIPEERLPPMMVGAIVMPIGLFWFAWTSDKDITWVPQVLAGVPIGMGIFMIFMQGVNYLLDVYQMFAASALAASGILRALAGAAFPLFSPRLYRALGVDWATTLLAFLTVAMVPVPIAFYIYGKKIRAMSRFAPTL